ncbi:unnamed protein product [Rotaria sp. Silwood1]|nr:unnamed protein product [Rotaria sp. Silwood1]CAF1680202.1 unnamed protein product [Rotaria sp. Silwood1]CAF3735136.1 unnamed protein product [Rotaria sp. Silwood1]CAF3851958.1 unnamed protein product [Rotaria sp. Silwood1]CAF3911839.1 unnamed protein product [Rotaria sp. Silwood1]
MHWLLVVVGWFLLINQSIGCTPPSFSSLNVERNFNLHRFLGIWYEIKWYTTVNIPPSDVWTDYAQSFQLKHRFGQSLLVYGKARLQTAQECFSFGPWLVRANNGAKMIVEKEDLNSNTRLNRPYYVLKTDYKNYALTYTCISTNYNLNQPCTERNLHLFSRKTSLSWRYLGPLYNYIKNVLCIDQTQLTTIVFHPRTCFRSHYRNFGSSERHG